MTDRLDGLLELDVLAAGHALRAGSLTAVELTHAYLERIAQTEDDLHAYVTVDAEGAVAAAERADLDLAAGHDRGPLHGMPVGVKDLIDTQGLRTTYGSIRFRDHLPAKDAEVVHLLRAAGAVILGKHATHEFAWGGRTDNPHYGPTHNPHDLARVPGGSSGGGGASVAAGSSLLAVGTDTAGSVRIPAAFCGCVGFKPTKGWISMEGVHPLAPSLDHIGVMGRTVTDVGAAFAALGGMPQLRGRDDVRRLRIGLIDGPSMMGVDSAVRAAYDDAVATLRAAGADARTVDWRLVDDPVEAILTLVRAEAEEVHRAAFARDAGSYGADLAELLRRGPVGTQERADASARVRSACAALITSFGGCDVLLGPTVPITAPLIGELFWDVAGSRTPIELVLTRLTSLADAAGVPAMSIPAPGASLPVGLQLMAPSGSDAQLLSIASAIETVLSESASSAPVP